MKLGIPYRSWQVRRKDEEDLPLEDTFAVLTYDDLDPLRSSNGTGPDEEDLGDSQAELEIIEEGDRS